MRKLIILLVLTAFIITLSSPILYAAQWDSDAGPNWVDQRYVDRADVSGDDSGWNDLEEPGDNNDNYDIFRKIFRYFKFIFIVPVNETTEDNVEDTGSNIISSRNTAGQ